MSVTRIEQSIVLKYRQYKIAGEFTCVYCDKIMIEGSGRHKDIATLDHILPRSKGGTNSWDNLIVCCMSCNSRRGNMPFIQWLKHIKNNNSKKVSALIAKIETILLSPVDMGVYYDIQRIRVAQNNPAARKYFHTQIL